MKKIIYSEMEDIWKIFTSMLFRSLNICFFCYSNLILFHIYQSCETTPDSEDSVLMQLASIPSTGSLSSRASRISNSAMSILAATVATKADLMVKK